MEPKHAEIPPAPGPTMPTSRVVHRPQIPINKPGKIDKLIPLIMNDIKAVGKEGKNAQQGFAFRKVDDVYNHINPIMAKHGVYTTHMIISRSEKPIKSKQGALGVHRINTYIFFYRADDGSYVTTEVDGEGIDYGDKSSNKCLSIADKYALVTTFKIPVKDIQDPDGETPETNVGGKPGKNAPNTEALSKCISKKQLSRLYAIAKKQGWDDAAQKELLKKWSFTKSRSELPDGIYQSFCEYMEKYLGPAQMKKGTPTK